MKHAAVYFLILSLIISPITIPSYAEREKNQAAELKLVDHEPRTTDYVELSLKEYQGISIDLAEVTFDAPKNATIEVELLKKGFFLGLGEKTVAKYSMKAGDLLSKQLDKKKYELDDGQYRLRFTAKNIQDQEGKFHSLTILYKLDGFTREGENDFSPELNQKLENYLKKDKKGWDSNFRNWIGDETLGTKVLIYNTHYGESYHGIYDNSIHNDKSKTVYQVSKQLAEKLQRKGVTTSIVEPKPNMIAEYAASKQIVQDALAKNPSIEYIIDIHRNAYQGMTKKETTLSANNKSYAKIAFVLGTGSSKYQENKALAQKLCDKINQIQQGLCYDIWKFSPDGKKHGEYNLSLSSKSMLIEVGGYLNTLEETDNSMEIFSNVIAEELGVNPYDHGGHHSNSPVKTSDSTVNPQSNTSTLSPEKTLPYYHLVLNNEPKYSREIYFKNNPDGTPLEKDNDTIEYKTFRIDFAGISQDVPDSAKVKIELEHKNSENDFKPVEGMEQIVSAKHTNHFILNSKNLLAGHAYRLKFTPLENQNQPIEIKYDIYNVPYGIDHQDQNMNQNKKKPVDQNSSAERNGSSQDLKLLLGTNPKVKIPEELANQAPGKEKHGQVIEVGGKQSITIDGKKYKIAQVRFMEATAYGNDGNGQWGPVDRYGAPLKKGVIAVDPTDIPYKRYVYVEGINNKRGNKKPFDIPDQGMVSVARDTGSYTKTHPDRIDIYIPTTEADVNTYFGVQHVKVYVLYEEDNS